MRRILVPLAIVALAAAAPAADAAPKKKSRTVKLAYVGFCDVGIADSAHGGPNTCPTPAEIDITTKTGEAYVKVAIKDNTGQPVAIRWWKNDDFGGTVATICKGNTKAAKFKAKLLSFKLAFDPTCGGVPTQGTLTVVISNLP